MFPRERFVAIPSLGEPTPEERAWRHDAASMSSRQRWEAIIRERSIADWGHLLTRAQVPEDALRAVRYLRHIVAAREQLIVTAARELGMCWDEIGVYLGLSRHAVRKRWLRRDARDTEDARDTQDTRDRGRV